MPNKSVVVLGIDPGYDRIGIAVIKKDSKESLLYSDCLITNKKDDFYKRLHNIGKKISEIIEKYSPDAMAIESLYITKNQKTAMRVSEARGVIAYEATKKSIPIYEYTPLEIKIAITGHGSSDKSQITKMIPLLVKLDQNKSWNKSKDDEFDAIATALTCLACEKIVFHNIN